MNPRLKRNAPALNALAKARKPIQKTMLSNASKDLVLSLVRCASDIIKGNVSLTPRQLKQLMPYEKLLKKFVSSKTALVERRKILQKGGFVGLLLKPLLGLLGSVLNQ